MNVFDPKDFLQLAKTQSSTESFAISGLASAPEKGAETGQTLK